MLAYLDITEPMWGWLLPAALVVPLVVHLFGRRVGRVVRFPTVRFLRDARRDAARRRRLRHWGLLALRMLILAALIAACMRPRWITGSADAAATAGRTVVFVLDRSASMTRSAHGLSLFDRARAAVRHDLGALDPARDRAAVVLVDRTPTALLPEPTHNMALLRDVLAKVSPTYEKGNATAALQLALAQATQSAADHHRALPATMILYSDMQASQWHTALPALPPGVSLRVHQVGAAAANLALSATTVSPAQPVVGQPTTVHVTVTNDSAVDVTPSVVLHDADVTQRRRVPILPWGSAQAAFTITPTHVGPAYVAVALADHNDAWRDDDRSGVFFTAVAARPVAVISAAAPDDPTQGAYFVRCALVPDAGNAAADTGIRLVSWRQQPQVAVVVNGGALDRATIAGLRALRARGGGIVWFVDSAASAAALAQVAAIGPAQWQPDADVHLGNGNFAQPPLDVFVGPSRAALLGQHFHGAWHWAPSAAFNTVLSFANGDPAVAVSASASQGRLAVFAAGLDPAAGDFVKQPTFAPLLHQLVRAVAAAPPPAPTPQPGDDVVLTVPGVQRADDVVVIGPDGQHVDHALFIDRAADRSTVYLTNVALPGPYAVRQASNGTLLAGVQVTIDPAESDLRALDVAALHAQHVSATAVNVAAAHASMSASRPAVYELWPWLLAALAVLLACEHLALVWVKRADHGRHSAPMTEATTHG